MFMKLYKFIAEMLKWSFRGLAPKLNMLKWSFRGIRLCPWSASQLVTLLDVCDVMFVEDLGCLLPQHLFGLHRSAFLVPRVHH
jgi:hypothetical protein